MTTPQTGRPAPFTVILEIPINPQAPNVIVAFEHDLPAALAFPGNEHVEVLEDPTRPGVLFILSRWASEEDYQAYAAWRATPAGATRLPEIAAGPPTVHRYQSYLSF